jgi:hypothetical protein
MGRVAGGISPSSSSSVARAAAGTCPVLATFTAVGNDGTCVVVVLVTCAAVPCGRVAVSLSVVVVVESTVVGDGFVVGVGVDVDVDVGVDVDGDVARVAVTFITTPPCCMIRCCSNVYLRCVSCFFVTGAACLASCVRIGARSVAVVGDVMSS